MRYGNIREVVLIKEDIVVRRLARSGRPGVVREIIVKLNRADDCRVYHRACGEVQVPVAVVVRLGGGKEYNLVLLSNNDECNGRVEAQLFACVCGRRGDHWERKKGGKHDELRMKWISSSIIASDSPSKVP